MPTAEEPRLAAPPRWLAGLNLSPRSTRAIDEALRDWRHEVECAASSGQRARAQIAGSIGLVRTTSLAAIHDLRVVSTGYWPAALLVGLLFFAVFPWLQTANFGQIDYPNVRAFEQVSLARTIAMALPATFFWALLLARSDQPAPLLGLWLVAIGSAAVMMGAVVPTLWAHYADVGLRRPGFSPSISPWSQFTMLCWQLVPSMFLANLVRIERRRKAIVAVALGVLGGFMLLNVLWWIAFHHGTLRTFTDAPQGVAWAGALWMPVAVVMAATRLVVGFAPVPLTLSLSLLLMWRQGRRSRIQSR